MGKNIDDKDLENISGAGGNVTPEEIGPGKPTPPAGIIPDPPSGGGSTGTGDEDNLGSGGDTGVNQG